MTAPRYRLAPLLTPAEENLIRCMLAGNTSSEALARELCISKSTVRAHLLHICGKIGAENRTDIALWAVRNGYGLEEVTHDTDYS